MELCEFMIWGRPVSGQTNYRKSLQDWKSLVHAEAVRAWAGRPIIRSRNVHLVVVYLWNQEEETPLDVDNVIKPVQDALEGSVISNDILVSDVESHRRPLGTAFDPAQVPPLLALALHSSEECVYVSVRKTKPLENFL